jgi:hypothetical protein
MSITKKKKLIHKKDDSISEEVKFCIECDQDLNNFDVNPMLKTKKEVLDNHENCKKTGKFKGDKCSKLFITEEDEESPPIIEDEF